MLQLFLFYSHMLCCLSLAVRVSRISYCFFPISQRIALKFFSKFSRKVPFPRQRQNKGKSFLLLNETTAKAGRNTFFAHIVLSNKSLYCKKKEKQKFLFWTKNMYEKLERPIVLHMESWGFFMIRYDRLCMLYAWILLYYAYDGTVCVILWVACP